MLTMMRIKYPRLYLLWTSFTSVITIMSFALVASFALVHSLSEDDDTPVIETSDLVLHTPKVSQGDSMIYSLWRKSFESCPGIVVTTFFPVNGDEDGQPKESLTIRRPFSTPGFNSPPRLIIRNQLPARIAPGKYRVQVGVDSRCPTRQRFDMTASFILEVENAQLDR